MAMDQNQLAGALEGPLYNLFQEMRESKEFTEKEFAERLSNIIADKVVNHIINNAVVSLNIENVARDAMSASIVVSGDGGASLKTSFLTYMSSPTVSANDGTGTIS